MSDAIISKKNFHYVDPTKVIVQDGWNSRKDFGDLESLMRSIIESGVLNPIHCKKDEDGNPVLMDGERRLRACLMAVDEGHDIRVPCFFKRKSISDTEAMFVQLIANDGKPFAPSEEGEAFRRLVDWGLNISEIQKRTGRTNYYVKSRLALADACKDLQKAVDSGKIAIGKAVKIVKDSDGSIDAQRQQVRDEEGKASVPRPKPVPSLKKLMEDQRKQARKFDGMAWTAADTPVIKEVMEDANTMIKELKKLLQEAGRAIEEVADIDDDASENHRFVVSYMHYSGESYGVLDEDEMWAVYCQGDGFGVRTPQELAEINGGWDWSHIRDSSEEGYQRMADEIRANITASR